MICYPSDTDWGCAFTAEQLGVMRADAATVKDMELAEARAWYTLASLTAYRLGVCPEAVRPVAACCAPSGTYFAAPVNGGDSHVGALPIRTIGALGVTPYVTGGTWVNGCGCLPIGCGCSSTREVVLPGPVGAIEKIDIGGEIVDPSRYRIDDGNVLVAVDPNLQWPLRQDVFAQPGQPDTFTVTYYRGAAPDELIRAAAGALAAEYYKLCRSDKNCRFPKKVKSVTRFGTTYDVDTTLFEGGITNIPEADFVIRMLNPHLLKQGTRVISVDAPRRTRRSTYGPF
ncbi:head-to-tail adaptor [Microbacterium phage Phinky]|nr:head-to-tail adaptor [Microbacterium phage Phinky]